MVSVQLEESQFDIDLCSSTYYFAYLFDLFNCLLQRALALFIDKPIMQSFLYFGIDAL
jgi:hypothetical protein